MFTKNDWIERILMLVTIIMLSACAPQVEMTPAATPAQGEPVTLRFAVADAEGRPSEPYVLEFVEQVNTLSNGNITIEPIWDAGATTDADFEVGVVQLIKGGQADLGLAGSRAFDTESITSFQALQAPFLITNDNLSKAVATSDIATRMLDNLSSAGLTGLTLWPEDLRHPFSIIPDKPILSPGDFEGATVRVVPSEVSHMLIEVLGGKPLFGDDYQVAESGLRQGASLTGTPTATGNVIFFAKYQVLFANSAAFDKLNEAQRTILLEAAVVTQRKAIAEHPSEADAAAAWCADGGTVVMASAEQVAAFETAAKPVFDQIEQDPLNAELILAIRELKAKTEPAPGAEACAPTAPPQGVEPPAESPVWSQGLPPNGVWQVELSADDFAEMGVLRSVAESDWAGTYILTLKDGKSFGEFHGLHGFYGKCQANYELVGDIVRFTYYQTTGGECEGMVEELQWRLDEEGLHFHLVAVKNGPPTELKAYYEAKPWQKVEEWSTGLPPNGVWQVELSAEDIAQFGVLQSTADEMAGTYTWTFQDGNAQIEIQGSVIAVSCMVNATVVEDFVRLQNVGSTTCNGDAYDDVQWRLDEGGLHFHLVDSSVGLPIELKATYEAKPWQKIADQ